MIDLRKVPRPIIPSKGDIGLVRLGELRETYRNFITGTWHPAQVDALKKIETLIKRLEAKPTL